MNRVRQAVIVDAVRTPVGKYGGVLKDIRVDDLSAAILRALVERTHIEPASVEDVFWGCANQAGEDNRNLPAWHLLLAGFPQSVPGDDDQPVVRFLARGNDSGGARDLVG